MAALFRKEPDVSELKMMPELISRKPHSPGADEIDLARAQEYAALADFALA